MKWMAGVIASIACVVIAPIPGRAESDYRDLRDISFFGSISATVHVAGVDDSATPGPSSAKLTRRAELRFSKLFPGIPYQKTDASDWSAPENAKAMGRLACRAWIDARPATATYQIKCQISTAAHLNIIEDGSMGYAPTDRIDDIVTQQFDRILTGFGTILQSVRNDQ